MGLVVPVKSPTESNPSRAALPGASAAETTSPLPSSLTRTLAEVARLVADFAPKRGPRGSISWFFGSENAFGSL